ncbi:metabolite traffic protein EboE [Glutamicibacter sp. FBE19]|uniref:metabolite traffic protein EboE n=1 Tax=Glutamicibacter sp. FBE19 TaxID=2761534 RepID=UPI00189685E6|nr:metabolite traffic protein EboE [Glutamicibacter sp. FBE19]MBF6671012.1 metabolite traffic protein EboE [Glutamicibacter sp. FBE19]
MRLSYCTNVHPAEDLEGVITQLRHYAGNIRRRAGLQVLGVGLWIPSVLATRLAASEQDRQALREVLEAEGLQLHTINAFPYGGFHDEVVKHAVYLPTWAEPARLEYTLRCAQILADLLPEGEVGSISTLPLAWRDPWDEAQDQAATNAFAQLSQGLRELKERTGRTVRVAIEPEPGCVLDTISDIVQWLGARLERGIDPEFVGVCVDTCHLAVSFADPAGAIAQIQNAGLRVVKVQASAALHVLDPKDRTARAALESFVEPKYLHQVRESSAAGVIPADDLDTALAELPGSGPWRVHFHIPLHHVPAAPLQTTTDVLQATVSEAGKLPYADEVHLDVETYTWSVLPQHGNAEEVGIVDGIAAELVWAEENLMAPVHAS